jgi:hypothetical protein
MADLAALAAASFKVKTPNVVLRMAVRKVPSAQDHLLHAHSENTLRQAICAMETIHSTRAAEMANATVLQRRVQVKVANVEECLMVVLATAQWCALRVLFFTDVTRTLANVGVLLTDHANPWASSVEKCTLDANGKSVETAHLRKSV